MGTVAVVRSEGRGGLERLVLRHGTGAEAEVYLLGAHVTSWKTHDGVERLFLSRESLFEAGKPIRGGVPICFPQFSKQGSLPQHGLVRTMAWNVAASGVAEDGRTYATLVAEDNEETRALWAGRFRAEYTVTLGARTLGLALRATNTGDEAWTCQAALHTYLRLEDVRDAAVAGLQGTTYLDTLCDCEKKVEGRAAITFRGETDSIYVNAPDEWRVVDYGTDRTVTVRKSGFPDAVVWNPWINKARNMADFGDDEYLRMVCTESALIMHPVTVGAGETWRGETEVVGG